MPVVAAGDAMELARDLLVAAGASADNAGLQAEILIEAELRGFPSHGLLRLERLIHRIGNGVADPATKGRHEWRGEALLSVDGERGLGPVVAMHALEACAERVGRAGVAVAAIANSNHIGMLAFYAEQAAMRGLCGIILTTSEALVHPWGGRRAMLGTNPIAIGVPLADGIFAMDVATGIVSMGAIHDRALRGEPIPPGWALDADGNPTTDANAAKAGAIAPFGGAKGFALGLAFELLVTALTGAAIGRDVAGTLDATQVCNKGDVIILIDPGRGQGQALSGFLDALRAERPAEGFDAVRVPGDRSRQVRAERLSAGLPLAEGVHQTMIRLADAAGMGRKGF